jgi:hypothetical protein
MGSELFLKASLDRENRLETITENRTAARINRERVGRAFVRFAAHSGLKADLV